MTEVSQPLGNLVKAWNEVEFQLDYRQTEIMICSAASLQIKKF